MPDTTPKPSSAAPSPTGGPDSSPTTPPSPEPEAPPTYAVPLPTPEEVERRWAARTERHAEPVKLKDAAKPFLDLIADMPQSSLPAIASPRPTGGASTAMTTRTGTSRLPSLASSEAAPMLEDATMADVAGALETVMAGHGRSMDAGRIKTVAVLVLRQGWKRAALREAAEILANSPAVRDELRYGGTLGSSHFQELLDGDSREVGEGEDKRVVVTRSGFALQVARQRLYGYDEAFGMWSASGQQRAFSDAKRPDGSMVEYPDAMFTVVDVDGQVWWRIKA